DVRTDAAVLVRLRKSRIVAVIAAQRVAGIEAPVRGEPLVETELGRVVLPVRLRQPVLTARAGINRTGRSGEAVGHHVERRGRTFTGVADDVGLVVSHGVDGARVLDAAVELLVDVPEAHGRDVAQLMLETEGRFLRAH